MERVNLLNAIDELKDSENIERSIDNLRELAVNFCDNYESEFNHIRDGLDALAPHIDAVKDAHDIAEKCSDYLY